MTTMTMHQHRYRISRDRIGLWDDFRHAPASDGRWIRITNSACQDFANTITAVEYKGVQKQKDKSGGYILARTAP